MSDSSYNSRAIYWLAVLTAVISLVPIGMGSLVTTLGAGMVFPDWPTSDGLGMFEYPFLQATGDEFIEHGHRLAGILIGITSMVLLGACWFLKAPRKLRIAALVVFLGVCIQGLLGGMRVLMDRQVMAFAHSVFGCCVFVSLWVTALMSSPRWEFDPKSPPNHARIRMLSFVLPTVCFVQYTVGGFIRHLGMLLHEHLLGATFVLMFGAWALLASKRSGNTTLNRRAKFFGLTMVLQVVVGILVWRTKFGIQSLGLVAVQHSMAQVISRSVHTVLGMAVVATAVLWAIQARRIVNQRSTQGMAFEPTPNEQLVAATT